MTDTMVASFLASTGKRYDINKLQNEKASLLYVTLDTANKRYNISAQETLILGAAKQKLQQDLEVLLDDKALIEESTESTE
jgi:hypothetical protein